MFSCSKLSYAGSMGNVCSRCRCERPELAERRGLCDHCKRYLAAERREPLRCSRCRVEDEQAQGACFWCLFRMKRSWFTKKWPTLSQKPTAEIFFWLQSYEDTVSEQAWWRELGELRSWLMARRPRLMKKLG